MRKEKVVTELKNRGGNHAKSPHETHLLANVSVKEKLLWPNV